MTKETTVRYTLHKPCKDCPFVRGNQFEGNLGKVRVQKIIDETVLGDSYFQCHKDKTLVCAGNLILQEKCNRNGNLSTRMAKMFGMLNESRLDTNSDVYDSPEEMIKAFKE